MTEKPTVKGAEPESPPNSPEHDPSPAVGARRRRSRSKKILVPTVLAALGLGLIVVAWFLYPRRAPVEVVTGAAVVIIGSSPYIDNHMGDIFYSVDPARPGVARVVVSVQLDGTDAPPGAYAQITLYSGAWILRCSPRCGPGANSTASPRFQLSPQANAVFYVQSRNYEVAANGATAAVGFPAVDSTATHPEHLVLQYNFPSAGSYDWSAFPGGDFSKPPAAFWAETVVPGYGPSGAQASARVASAVNPAVQQHDSNLTLAVGILFGIGGGALVAAVQETLRAND
jgi:hypothetical protein